MKWRVITTVIIASCEFFNSNAENIALTNSNAVVVKRIIKRDADTCLNEVVRSVTNRLGVVVSVTNHYTSLATGMNLAAADGSWTPASTEIEVDPDGGAIAHKTRHTIHFSADITDTNGAVVLQHGQRTFRSKPLCISYWDSATGQSVLISEFRSTIASLTPGGSKIVWNDCATDFKCNLIIDNKVSGMDQCLEILEQPPAPSEFGLHNESTQLQLITEFLAAPEATCHSYTNRGIADDQFVRFGHLTIPPGKAFKIGDAKSVHVGKHWAQLVGRQCLIEQIPYTAVQNQLNTLPQHASLSTQRRNKRIASRALELPSKATNFQPRETKVQIAKNSYSEQGLILDYSIISSTSSPMIFESGVTYLIEGFTFLTSTNIVMEGGTVIKYSGSDASIIIGDTTSLRINSSPYNPVIFTDLNDNSVGEVIDGSTGSPDTSANNLAAIIFSNNSSPNAEFGHVRFTWMNRGFVLYGGGTYTFRDMQFVNCGDSVVTLTSNTCINVFNALYNNCGDLCSHDTSNLTLNLQHITTHGISLIIDSGATNHTLSANNCLFVGVSDFGASTNGCLGTSAVVTDDTGVFDVVGAGGHYLPTNSPYHGAGDMAIDATLFESLADKTTFAPILLDSIDAHAVLTPRTIRDTNSAPDLGYHYDPLDYAFVSFSVATDLLLTNGVVVATDYSDDQYSWGIILWPGGSLISEGTPAVHNRIVRYNTVQELPSNAGGSGMITSGEIHCRFTDFLQVSGPPQIYGYGQSGNISLTDCQFRGGGGCWFDVSDSLTISVTNCLFHHGEFTAYAEIGSIVTLAAYNNLFYHSGLNSFSSSWSPDSTYFFRDNVFYHCAVELSSADAAYNAHTPVDHPDDTEPFSISGDGDVIIATNFTFQTGPYGEFYQPTNSPLLQAGSRSATDAGLSDYTVLTNQITDSSNQVSIGFHYVAFSNSPPTIVTQQSNQTVTQGATAIFGVMATGTSPISYQWQKNGTNISGAILRFYTKTNAQASDEGSYTVIVTNVAGAATSSTATLTVVIPPSITTQPASQTVNQGQNATFSVVATGTATLSYQWQFNGANISGATTSSYTKTNVQSSDVGTYRVAVMNTAGSVTSSGATLAVNLPPSITAQPSGQTLVVGQTAMLSVTATGTYPLTYQWQKNGANISGAISTSYSITNVQNGDAGSYHVVVTNVAGTTTSSNALLTVIFYEPDCSTNTASVLADWNFDDTTNPLTATAGQIPLLSNNVQQVASPWTNAVKIDSTNAANLSYRYVETNGLANLNCQQGSLRLWLKPNWNNGSGPGNVGRIVEMGDTNSTDGWWSLWANAAGTQLSFQTKSNGNLTTYFTQSISDWNSNYWYHLVLNYSSNQTALYTNGMLAQTGAGLTNLPNVYARNAYGFSLGTDHGGTNQIHGCVDVFSTFCLPLSDADILSDYINGLFTSSSTSGNGIPSWDTYNQLHGLTNNGALQVFTPLK